MKSFFKLLFCFSIFSSHALHAQMICWAEAQRPTFSRPQWETVFKASFIDSLNGWAISHGVDGPDNSTVEMTRVLNTTDGGKSWKIRYQDSELVYFGIDFVDQKHGWISGNGKVKYTSDGGKTWNLAFFNRSVFYDGLDVCFTDTLNGWVVCAGGQIYHTTDGGKSWQAQRSGTEKWLLDVEMLNKKLGWAVGGVTWDGGVILNTTSGGATWTVQWSDPHLELRDLHIIDSLEVWAVGENNSVLHTIDGGRTWKIQRIWGTGGFLSGVNFLNPQYGWIVGETGYIAYTFDGGATWIPDVSGAKSWLNDVAFLDSQRVSIVGYEATFLYNTGSVAPTIASFPETLAVTNETYVYSIEASGCPQPLRSLTVGPPKMRLNQITGFLYWTPTRSDTGRQQIIVQAENPAGVDKQDYFLHVIYRNHTPYFNYIFPQQDSIRIVLDDTIKFLASAHDIDDDSLNYKWKIDGVSVSDSIIHLPGQGQFHAMNFAPTRVGNYSVMLSVCDFTDTTRRIWQVMVSPITGINEATSGKLPQNAVLHQSHPNPFNSTTMIRYDLPVSSYVIVEIYNLLGQKIRTVEAQWKLAGRHQINWDGKNDAGVDVSNAVYVYQMTAGHFKETRKVILLR